jgi:L-asparaginase/Glu-tRNA(Gln) amidotransferase subunit D
MKQRFETTPEAKISSIRATPGMPPNLFERATEGANAVIFIGFTTGTTPTNLNEIIKRRTDEGIPVFILSDNPRDSYGIINPRKYETQVEALEAGAIPLQAVNVNKITEVGQAIKKAFATGKRGGELAKVIKEQFSLPSDSELLR